MLVNFLFLSLTLHIEADFYPSTSITIGPPDSKACIDFMDLVVDDSIALEGDQSFTICVGNSTAMVVILDDDSKRLYIYIIVQEAFYFFSTVPIIESDDIIINEDGGSAVVVVRLVNEIEKDLTLDYGTGEVPNGAIGMCVPSIFRPAPSNKIY